MSVLCENESHHLSNFLQTHIFWNFDHISRIYNQTNYRNNWFPNVIIILIMIAQALFFNVFSKKDLHLIMPLRVPCVISAELFQCKTLSFLFETPMVSCSRFWWIRNSRPQEGWLKQRNSCSIVCCRNNYFKNKFVPYVVTE